MSGALTNWSLRPLIIHVGIALFSGKKDHINFSSWPFFTSITAHYYHLNLRVVMNLSNKHRYTISRFNRLLLAPVYSFISLLLKKNNCVIITGSLNNEYSDNAKALFEMLIEDQVYCNRVYFVINDKKKRLVLNSIYPGRFISNLTFKEKIFILKARFWFCSAMELPLTTFFQRKLRRVIHLGHGMLLKKIGLIENEVNWYKKMYYALINSSFTFTIATTPFFMKDISSGFGMPLNKVLMTPQPKTYQIAFPNKIHNKTYSQILVDNKMTNILYAPTWRPYAMVELFPFKNFELPQLSEFLIKENIHIWLRVHPRFEQFIKSDLQNCSNIHIFSAKDYSDINSYLFYFDALITDYSSIYYDYLTLERPVLFFDYDLKKYSQFVGVIDNFERVKSTETTKSINHLKQQLLSIKGGCFDLSRIKSINHLANYPVSNDLIADVVLKKLGLA